MRTNRAPLGLLVAALLALTIAAVTTAAPPPAAADEGTEARGVAEGTHVTPMDLARATQLASKPLQDWLGELFRTGEGTYQSGCVSNGFKCVAGTGFNVNVTAGRCLYDYATGASAWVSRTRVLHLLAAEAATDWDANPGADTYYVHVAYGETTSGGVEWPDPVITVDTDASLAGTYTVCSIVVGGAEPDATTYTINDLRTVLPGPGYFPGDISIGDDLAVGDDANVVGTLTLGPAGGPATATLDAAAGTADFAGTVEVGDISIDSVVLASTPAEIDAVADLSAAGALPRSCKLLIDTAPERAGGAHAICTLPAAAVVTDVWIEVEVAEATEATKVLDVGPTLTPEGYAKDFSVAAAPAFGRPGMELDGTGNWYESTTRGELLADFVAGANADDRGLYSEFPDMESGGLVINATIPAAGFNEFVGTVTVLYYELP